MTDVGTELRATATPIDGVRLQHLAARESTVTYVEGTHKGQTIAVTMTAAEDGAWKENYEGIRAMVMKEVDGQIVLLAEEDVAENVAITYDPPLMLLPKRVAMDEKVEGDSAMTVNHLKTGKNRDSGKCHYETRLLGMQKVQTPAGEFDAYIFETIRTIDLSLAKVKVTIQTAHVAGKGIVMTRVDRKTRAIGFINLSKSEAWHRASW